MLEETRALGYHIFYDIPGDGFNVDHVLIGPGGVFALETKAVSSRDANVDCGGKRVLLDGHAPGPRPHRPGPGKRRPPARPPEVHHRPRRLRPPIVLYLGWWVNPQPRGVHVWVLNPKNLAGFSGTSRARLSGEDSALSWTV